MLNTVLITPEPTAAKAIARMIGETGFMRLVFGECPPPPHHELLRLLQAHDPEVLLIDVGEWSLARPIAANVRKRDYKSAWIAFRPPWNRLEGANLETAGFEALLEAPFTTRQLESTVYQAIHTRHPAENENLLVFLPAKAGSGCTTVVMNTAFALARESQKRVLVIEADRRSGILDALLNVSAPGSLGEALQRAETMTGLEWAQHRVTVNGVDFVLNDLETPTPLPTWADYFLLLRFLRTRYDYILVDMPEAVNEATAEVVRSARSVFVVTTPEVPPLKLAGHRIKELEQCGLPSEQTRLIVNRWSRDSLPAAEVEKLVGRGVFASLPGDYPRIQEAILESRGVAAHSRFYLATAALARKLGGLENPPPPRHGFDLLRRFGRAAAETR
jgi:pilus assembly protein CpaE